jgi:hypothetical protein
MVLFKSISLNGEQKPMDSIAIGYTEDLSRSSSDFYCLHNVTACIVIV